MYEYTKKIVIILENATGFKDIKIMQNEVVDFSCS